MYVIEIFKLFHCQLLEFFAHHLAVDQITTGTLIIKYYITMHKT